MAEDNKVKVVEAGWDDEVAPDGSVKVVQAGWDDDVDATGSVKKKEDTGFVAPLGSTWELTGSASPTQTKVAAKKAEPVRGGVGASVPAIKVPTFARTRQEAEAQKPSPVYPTGEKATERMSQLEMRKNWLESKMKVHGNIAKGLEVEFEKTKKEVEEKQRYVESLARELSQRSDISNEKKQEVYDAAVADYESSAQAFETNRKNLKRQYDYLSIAERKLKETGEEESNIAKQQTKIGSAYDALNVGLNNLWAMTLRAPQYAYNQMLNVQNNVFKAIGAENLVVPLQKDGLLSDVAKHFDANAEAYNLFRSKKYSEYDNSITKAIEKGDYDAAIDLAAQGIIESAPITAGISLATMAGVPSTGIIVGGGVVFGGEKYKQMEEEYGDKIDVNTKMANSFTTGLIEGIFEEFGTAKIIESLVGRGLTKEAAKQEAKSIFKRVYEKAMLRSAPVTSALLEGLSEAETTFTENVIDIVSGTKAPDQVLDGVSDAFIVGAGTGAIMGILLKPKKEPIDPELRKKANEEKERLRRINETLVDPNVPDEIKNVLSEQSSSIATAILEANIQDDKIVEGFSAKSIDRLESIANEIEILESGLDAIAEEDSKEIVKNKIKELNNERQYIFDVELTKKELRSQRDAEIAEIEKMRPDLTDDDLLLIDLPDFVDRTLDRVYEGLPTDPTQIGEAIDALDKKFDALQAYKNDPKRTHTIEQIDSLIDVLSEAKSSLQQYENEIRPGTEAQAEGKGKPEIPAAQVVAPEQEEIGVRLPELVEPQAGEAVPEVVGEVAEEEEEGIKPIRQLGTGANVYFETKKHRVNDDSKSGKTVLIVGSKEDEFPMATYEFDTPDDAVKVAQEIDKIYPDGVPDAVLIDKVIDDIKSKLLTPKQEQDAKEQQGRQMRDQGKQGEAEGLGNRNLPEGDRAQLQDGQKAEEVVSSEFVTNAGRKAEKPKTGVGSGEVNPTFSEKKVLVGDKTTIRFADGTKEEAEFMVVELDDIMASHNEESFNDTEGFPTMPDGRNVNSRNYKGDKAAQGTVENYAMNLDPDILITDNVTTDQGAPIITEDGIVISANGRTMSMKLAAKRYPKKYAEYKQKLIEKAKRYGIDPKAVATMKNPVLVKINRNVKEYSVDSFDRYNPQFQKAEAPIDRLLKQSYIIRNNPAVRDKLMKLLSQYDSMADLYASAQGRKELLNFLTSNKFILPQEMAEYADEKANFTDTGKKLAEDIIVGAILRPETIKASQDVKAFRNNVINAIAALAQNYTLGEFSLEDMINEAVLLQQKVAAWGAQKDFWKYLLEQKMFEAINPDFVIMNRLIDSGSKSFKQFIEKYNDGAKGQGGEAGAVLLAFDDVVAKSKQEVLDYITKQNLSKDELQILALVYDRYAEFAEQNERGIKELGERLKGEKPGEAEPEVKQVKPKQDEQEAKAKQEDGEPMPKGVSGVRPEGKAGEEGAELRPEEKVGPSGPVKLSFSAIDDMLSLPKDEYQKARNELKTKYGAEKVADMIAITRKFEQIITGLEQANKIRKECP